MDLCVVREQNFLSTKAGEYVEQQVQGTDQSKTGPRLLISSGE